MAFRRVDRMSNMRIYDKPSTPITSIQGYENGVDFKKIASTMPYMYTDAPERIEFIADEEIVDQIVDWFGTDVRMEKITDEEKKIRVHLFASPTAMEYWALQYVNHVEVVKPESVRQSIREALAGGMEKYK